MVHGVYSDPSLAHLRTAPQCEAELSSQLQALRALPPGGLKDKIRLKFDVGADESTLPETRMRALAEAGRERARRACGDAAAAGSETFSPCAVRGRSGYVTPPSIGAPFIVSQQN